MQLRLAFAAALVATTFATSAFAEDDDDIRTETRSIRLSTASPGDIGHMASNGYRLTDIEVEDPQAPSFSAVMVENTGEFQTLWWWYYNISAADVSDYLSQNNARLIDLETYLVNGTRYFTVVMVRNTGSHAATWWWYYNITWASLTDLLTTNNRRPIDVETYLDGNGNRRFACVMVSNAGGNYEWWQMLSNVTIGTIADALDDENARPVDLEVRGPDRYTVILKRRQGMGYGWYFNASSSFIDSRRECFNGRYLDVEPVGTDRYLAIFLMQQACEGDVNGDGVIDVDDLVTLLAGWGMCPD